MATFCRQLVVMHVELKPKNRVAKKKTPLKQKRKTVAAANIQKTKTIVVAENADIQTAQLQQLTLV